MDTTKRTKGVRAANDSEKQDSIAHSTAVDTNSNSLRLSAEDVNAEKRASMIVANHQWDPNLPEEKRNSLENALRQHDVEAERAIVIADFEDDSPYPEVRAAVRNYDEDVPANTIRAWVIGMIFCTIGSAVNMLFSMRNPSTQLTSLVSQLLGYPVGLAWAKFMPNKKHKTFGIEWNLNPGPFNLKEHTLIVVMANASYSGGAAYSTDTLLAQIAKYGQDFGWAFALLYTLSMQSMGYGLAGLVRRFLVWPAAMIWPTNLVSTSLLYTLHSSGQSDPTQTNGWRIGRYKWFMYLAIGGTIYQWVPGFLFQALSQPFFATWIKPNNILVNQILGGNTGFGLIPITFDWNMISNYMGSPLIPPFHAIMSTMGGLVIFYLIAAPIVYYTNTWYSKFLPIFSQSTFDNTGQGYVVKNVLNPDFTLNIEKYKAYSPLLLPMSYAMGYGLSFAGIASTIVHTGLFHGKEIWHRFRSARDQEEDVHLRLMKKYPENPDWLYLAFFAVNFAISLGVVLGWETHLPAWAHIISLLMAALWLVPVGMIQATTNIQIGLNVITEFLIGYMLPGRPLAMMMFKSYGYITMTQALSFVGDLKLGHYMKVPPRTMFWSQVVATIWSAVINIAVMYWALGNIDQVCTPAAQNTNKFTCPNATVFFNASIIWGVVGPARLFGPGSTYSALMWFFLMGALAPVAVWALARKFPNSFVRYINMPVLFSGTGQIPPATPWNYFLWGSVGITFNKFIRDRWRGWWSTYNYITSAGMDVGVFVGLLIIFFCVGMQGKELHWWGNDVNSNTLDHNAASYYTLGVNQTFGPKQW